MSEDTPPRGDTRPPHLRPDEQGAYAWDRWEKRALAAGLNPELAQLGRTVMREAAMHDWRPGLQAECGWSDEGAGMLALALGRPEQAEQRWDWLLETDGERGRWEGNEWRRLTARDFFQSPAPELSQTELLQAVLLIWRLVEFQPLTDQEVVLVDRALWQGRRALGVTRSDGHYYLSSAPF
ncbi:MAG: hypothetical protein AB1758_33585 [Candidatus Eremiobacterota bacterium]